MGYYDTLSPEELEKYKKDYIEYSKTGDQYSVVYRNGRYEINFFMSWWYIPDILIRHNIGKFHLNDEKKICFEFSDDCPSEIKESMLEYYGNGSKEMVFTDVRNGQKRNTLDK